MSTLDDAIARAKASAPNRIGKGTLDLALGDELVSFEFTRLEPDSWNDLKAQCPPREGSKSDINLGYNPHALARIAGPLCATVVSGDERSPVTPEQWAGVWAVLDAPDKDTIATFLWGLNVWEPLQRVAAAKKALRGGRKTQRSSRAN